MLVVGMGEIIQVDAVVCRFSDIRFCGPRFNRSVVGASTSNFYKYQDNFTEQHTIARFCWMARRNIVRDQLIWYGLAFSKLSMNQDIEYRRGSLWFLGC